MSGPTARILRTLIGGSGRAFCFAGAVRAAVVVAMT